MTRVISKKRREGGEKSLRKVWGSNPGPSARARQETAVSYAMVLLTTSQAFPAKR